MQLHKRHTIETVRLKFDWYERGLASRTEVQTQLGIKRRRFFSLLKLYRSGKLNALSAGRSNAHRRIPRSVEDIIRVELQSEKAIIEDRSNPVGTYNYRVVRDSVTEKTGRRLSAQTVRNRAKDWGYYAPRPESKPSHARVVLTTATGLLLQHDASHHKWSPLAEDKWCLITTIDDYSRMLLNADLWLKESTWAHIMALKSVVVTYGAGIALSTPGFSET